MYLFGPRNLKMFTISAFHLSDDSPPAEAKKREMNSVWRGRLAYEIYRAVTRAAAPALYYLVEWRRRRRWWRKQGNTERIPFAAPGVRPPGTPLVWVHAVSLGEALAALPLVRHHYSLSVPTSSFVILMTTTTFSALYAIVLLLFIYFFSSSMSLNSKIEFH